MHLYLSKLLLFFNHVYFSTKSSHGEALEEPASQEIIDRESVIEGLRKEHDDLSTEKEQLQKEADEGL